jgi:hypothetical protein
MWIVLSWNGLHEGRPNRRKSSQMQNLMSIINTRPRSTTPDEMVAIDAFSDPDMTRPREN